MTDSRDRAQTIFLNALEIEAEGERAAYLKAECGEDDELRREVEQLLDHAQRLGRFMDAGEEAGNPTIDQPITEKPGTVIGPYKLLQKIGEGGFGVVYMADQAEPVKRRVALKIIKPGMDTRQVIARFEAERQALAMMDHPNIARVLDAGTTGEKGTRDQRPGVRERQGAHSLLAPDPWPLAPGRPYFVMDLVKGVPITQYCDEHHLTPRERLELFVPVCQAIQHAHQKGVIHRDIKPTNILVAEYDDRAVPKIIDFGVAKATEQRLTEKTMFTQFGQVIGTLEYMSPEQAKLNQFDIDTRSDIYSLGVVLYELLTGETPFDRQRLRSAAFDEMLRIIREEEPPKPSLRLSTSESLPSIAANRQIEPKKLSTLVRGELDWIVMKALEKDRSRRYETANGFANDIQRYLNDEPVVACPPSVVYRFRKFARRNKAAFATAAVLGVTLFLGIIGTTWQAIEEREARQQADQAWEAEAQQRMAAESAREEAELGRRREQELRVDAEHQRQLARQQRDIAKHNLYLADMRQAQHDATAGLMSRLESTLLQKIPLRTDPDFRSWEWYYFLSRLYDNLLTFPVVRGGLVDPIAWSPDGQRLALACGDRTVRIWDVTTEQFVCVLRGHSDAVLAIDWMADGTRLASASADGTVRIWDVDARQTVSILRGHTDAIVSVRWSPSGEALASASRDQTVRVWDCTSEQAVHVLNQSRHPLVWSPSGGRLASLHTDTHKALIWDVNTGQIVRRFPNTRAIFSFGWSPDGAALAIKGTEIEGPRVKIVNTASGEVTQQLDADDVFSLAWDPKGLRFAAAAYDKTARVWDAQSWELLRKLKGHTASVDGLAWDAEGTRLATGSRDETVRIWSMDSDLPLETLRGHTSSVMALSWNRDARILASASWKDIKVWEVTPDHPSVLASEPGSIRCWIKTSDQKADQVAAVSEDGTVRIWNPLTGQNLRTLNINEANNGVELHAFEGKQVQRSIDWNPRTLEIAWSGLDSTIRMWDTTTAQSVRTLTGHSSRVDDIAWSPDGQRLASGDHTGVLKVWDSESGEEVLSVRGHEKRVTYLAWSNDGRCLASGAWDGLVKIWDSANGKELHSLRGHASNRWIGAVAWSPDDRRLATGGFDATVRIWDVDDGHELSLLRGHTARVADLAWSRDGKRVASVGGDTVRIWDADQGREILVFPFLVGGGRSLAWSVDGTHLIAVDDERRIHDWDASTGYRTESHPVESWTAVKVRYFSNEGRRLSQAEDFDNARSAYGMAILVQERLVQDHSHVPEHREKLAELLGSLGLVLHSEQDYSEAIAKFKRAVQIQRRLSEEFSEIPAYRRQLVETSVSLAKTLMLQGESDEAKRLCEQAMQIVGSDTALSDLRREIEGLMPIQREDSSTRQE